MAERGPAFLVVAMNVSIRPKGARREFGNPLRRSKTSTRFRFIEKAIIPSAKRQIETDRDGGKVARNPPVMILTRNEDRSCAARKRLTTTADFP